MNRTTAFWFAITNVSVWASSGSEHGHYLALAWFLFGFVVFVFGSDQ